MSMESRSMLPIACLSPALLDIRTGFSRWMVRIASGYPMNRLREPFTWTCTNSPQSVGGPRADETGGGLSGSPRCVRIFRIGPGSVMNAMSRLLPPHPGHSRGFAHPEFSPQRWTCLRGAVQLASRLWIMSPPLKMPGDFGRGFRRRDTPPTAYERNKRSLIFLRTRDMNSLAIIFVGAVRRA